MLYRPDVDGLRAIAILLVLMYHGGLALFPSGFVGVDVFFVISGFLITSIIHEAIDSKHFSFIDFYNRRLWRLQPVFICLIVVTTCVTLLFFFPDDLMEFNRTARKTSLFISNIFFKNSTTGYFAPNTMQIPLLHTWSLSIEWQCYLILPLAMYGLHRLFNKRNVTLVIYLLCVLFFVVSLHNGQDNPAQSYYQFSSRIFEFLVGSCVALMPIYKRTLPSFAMIFGLNSFSVLALGLIFYIASLDGILLGYPNWYACMVCLSTGLLIGLGRLYPELASITWLTCKPLVFIGVLSYSLYIWHWPIFALIRYQGVMDEPGVLILAYLLTFVLGYLSWRYIEKPSRRLNQMPFQYTVVCLLLLPILFTHVSAQVIKTQHGFPQRFNSELVTIYNKLDKYSSKDRPLCISNTKTDSELHCKIGDRAHAAKTAMMIGDSVANHYWGFMDTIGRAAKVSILVQGMSSCITLPGIYLYDWDKRKNQLYQSCYDETQNYYRKIKNSHFDYVILGQIWSSYVSDSVINQLGDERSEALAKTRLEVALNEALALIIDSGARPVLIKSTPWMKENFHDCFFKHIKLRKPYVAGLCNFNWHMSQADAWLEQLFSNMQNKHPQLILIDPKQVQCDNKVCKAEINGVPVYRDTLHITDYASYHLGKLYLKRFGNPFIG